MGGAILTLGIDNLIRVSKQLGSYVAYIQGGGGNTSLKTCDTQMYIKASGGFLADTKDETGFLPVNWKMLRDEVCKCENEADYAELLTASKLVKGTSQRPSIETGFHAILDKCTLHSHSVWANLLNCAEDGEALVSMLFPDAIWIPYATPGLALTKSIIKRLDGKVNVTIFLQNHGIVVSGPDADRAHAMHCYITDTIRAAYPTLMDFDEINCDQDEFKIDGLLFPDQAIYHSNPVLADSRAGRETMRACNFLIYRMRHANLNVKYIDDSERDVLLNMESEKFRQKLVSL